MLDGWMDGWMDGGMDGWRDGWMEGGMEEWREGGREGGRDLIQIIWQPSKAELHEFTNTIDTKIKIWKCTNLILVIVAMVVVIAY